jgi:hypothetical protein
MYRLPRVAHNHLHPVPPLSPSPAGLLRFRSPCIGRRPTLVVTVTGAGLFLKKKSSVVDPWCAAPHTKDYEICSPSPMNSRSLASRGSWRAIHLILQMTRYAPVDQPIGPRQMIHQFKIRCLVDLQSTWLRLQSVDLQVRGPIFQSWVISRH